MSLTPELTAVATNAAALVPAAGNSAATALDVMKKNKNSDSLFGILGGGSDHVGFVFRMVVPSIAISAGGSQGTSYHSNYDTTAWYRATVGEDYEPAIMVTRATLSFAALMSNQTMLPYQFEEFGRIGLQSLDELTQRAQTDQDKLEIETLRPLLMLLRSRAHLIDVEISKNSFIEPRSQQRLYLGMKKFIKAFHDPVGLPDRPWYRNLWVATDPSDSYSPSLFPMIRDALQGSNHALANAVSRTGAAIQRALSALELMQTGLQPTDASTWQEIHRELPRVP